ncbi:MAG: hypothetical protein MUF87_08300 [Anaerolineae bacterium]|jgi:hypothetical protein|nr:hypothetical protein [Anaerolineae bacterium]
MTDQGVPLPDRQNEVNAPVAATTTALLAAEAFNHFTHLLTLLVKQAQAEILSAKQMALTELERSSEPQSRIQPSARPNANRDYTIDGDVYD